MSEQYPIELKETVLLNFTAKWCGYCKKMNKILDQYDLGNISLVSIDFDKQKSLVKQYGVNAVPTLVLIKNEVEVKRHVGLLTQQELEHFIKEK